jgi:hypothetical protein
MNMSEAERLKLAELVSSRVCESLIGPIGAVVNGVELLRIAQDGRTTAATQSQIAIARASSIACASSGSPMAATTTICPSRCTS